jgi:putative ABC transport system permease protein
MSWWWRQRRDDDLDVEVRAHLEMAARDRVADGERPDEAARLARREFGNVAQVKEITREIWGWGSLERFWQDLGYGLRLMRRNPGFTITTVLSLALGIGANTAIFTVVHSVLLGPLPYHEPDRLVMVYSIGSMRSLTWNDGPFFDPDYLAFRKLTSFSALASFGGGEVSLNDASDPVHVQRARVTASLFPLLGVGASLGRVFGEDEQASSAAVVLLSDALWRGRYLADPGVVGRVVRVEGVPHTVIGVMPPDFRFPVNADIWVPLALRPTYRGNAMHRVIGRLAPGVSAEQARAEVEALLANISTNPRQRGNSPRASIVDLRESMVGKVRWLLLTLLGAVGCVILIACTNVANLLMARSDGRGREMSVRASLGASRTRLVRQLLTESVALAICGGAIGLLMATTVLPTLLRWVPPDMLPRSSEVRVSRHVLAFTFGLSVVTGLVFGLLPALASSRADTVHFDKLRTARGTTRGERRFRGTLIVLETALVLVLLIGAGLLLKSFWKLQHVDPGFRPEGLMTMTLLLPERSYQAKEVKRDFYEGLLERIEQLPDVSDVAAVNLMPFGVMGWAGDFEVEGGENGCPDFIVAKPAVSENYFRTMGIPLKQGRLFDRTDRDGAPSVAVVSESVARACWPGRTPLGQRIRMDDHPMTVVGVAGDVRQRSLEAAPVAAIYVPLRQEQRNFFLWSMTYVMRPSTPPGRQGDGSLTAAIREQVRALDPELPVLRMAPLEGILSTSVAEPRFRTALLLTFAGLALILAVVGIYGIVSYEVVRRTAELGIRRALGARGRDVLQLVIGRAAVLVGIGVVAGIVVASTATRALEAFLYAVEPTDLMTFLFVSAGLVFVALLATLVPARRAMTIDPVVALRHD